MEQEKWKYILLFVDVWVENPVDEADRRRFVGILIWECHSHIPMTLNQQIALTHYQVIQRNKSSVSRLDLLLRKWNLKGLQAWQWTHYSWCSHCSRAPHSHSSEASWYPSLFFYSTKLEIRSPLQMNSLNENWSIDY